MRKFWKILLCHFVVAWLALIGWAQPAWNSNGISLAEFQSAVAEQGGAIRSFQVEGFVCAIARERRMLALQDATATVLVELPTVNDAVKIGDRVMVSGSNCLVARSRFGIQIPPEVVNNDRRHSALLKTGKVFLEAGFQPISLEWFNGGSEAALRLECAGPGVTRQTIPAELLWCNQHPGLEFSAYKGDWSLLPDFSRLKPTAQGMATNFSLTYAVRSENTALVFHGFLKIQSAGIYTFYLTSDDGSRLEVGHSPVRCLVKPGSSRSVAGD